MELERHGIVVQPGGTVPFLPLTFQAGSGGGLRPPSGHSRLRGSVEAFMLLSFRPPSLANSGRQSRTAPPR